MATTRREFLWSSLGVAISANVTAALPTTQSGPPVQESTTSNVPFGSRFGSGHFGRWDEDEFGLPIFRYTANQATDPHAVTDVQPGILGSTEHIHQVGNDRITALASNYGTVRVRQDEGCPKILNDIDPETSQFGGGLGYLTDGNETLGTHYDGSRSNFERIFGTGYFRKRVAGASYSVDQVIVAPFGDDPVLLSQVTITNHSSASAHLRWVEYWGCQPYQLSFRAWMEAFSNPGTATKLRRAVGRRFSHNFSALPGKQGLRESKHFEGRPSEEEAAWHRMIQHGDPYGFITPVRELQPGTQFETTSIPDTFLVSLDGPVSAMSSDAAAFFGTGGPEHPSGLQNPFPSELESSTANAGMLLEPSFELAPRASRTMHFLYGYLPEGFSLDVLIAKYQQSAGKVWVRTREFWKQSGLRFEVASQPWVRRESAWNHYYLRSAQTYDDYFGEHILNQNGFYQYTMGFQGAPRDPLQHAMPFLFSDPQIVQSVLRYTLKEVRDDGSLPYAIVGHGAIAPMLSDRASDLPLWLLWAASEYVLATRDTAFLKQQIPARLSAEAGKSDSAANLLRRCYEHQVRDVGVGKHGIVRMLVDDWNDGLIYTWAPSDLKACIETSESVLNAAMSAWVFDKYAQMLAFSGDPSGLVEKCRATAEQCRKAVAAQWNGQWFRRAWLGEKLGWLGESTLWIEPQPWAILSGAATAGQSNALIRTMDQYLRQGPLGARQMSDGPDMKGNGPAERGTLESGAIWPSLNQTLVWALAASHPAMAWEEWRRNTLAHHAETYPNLWYGAWNGNDSYNTPANSNPGGAADQLYFHGTDFPVLNLHAHACFLYSASKLLGLDFDETGLRLNLNLPENEYRFDSPLFGVVKTHGRFEGWYRPSRPGTWTIRILLEKDALATIRHAEVNGKRVEVRRQADGSVMLTGASTAEAALQWKLF
jgi:hypothetical protein